MKIKIEFTAEEISIPELRDISSEVGAVVEFQGLVRKMEGENALAGLFYEAYEPMARIVLEKHLRELGAVYGCEAVTMIHRIGWVPVGEASLFIRVISTHRAEALKLLGDAIDRLKHDVPIWKIIR